MRPGIVIPTGRHAFDDFQTEIGTSRSRPVDVYIRWRTGQFLTGHADIYNLTVGWRPTNRLQFNAGTGLRDYRLPQGEFQVRTSTFNAEYGRNPGVMISINTKSGSNQFHGTLYEFLRNNALDARQPFDTSGTTQKLRFNQFGGNLGGPIVIPGFSAGDNKKLFFFFNYEGTRGCAT